VSTSNIEPFTKKQIVIGGVTYHITISRLSAEIYRADWTCSECGEDGAWSPLSGDPLQAAKLAKVGLQVHHSLLHQHRPKSLQKAR